MEDKRKKWADTLQKWQESGKTITAFCFEQNLHYNQFAYWRDKLFPKKPPSFIELPPQGGAAITIEVAGVCVKVERDFDEQTLCTTLRLLKTL